MAASIIDGIVEYFLDCPLLKDGCMRIDYLGDSPVEYVVETMLCDPLVHMYISGDSIRQYLFAFGSREYYSMERLEQAAVNEFYEQFADWVEARNRAGILPEMPEGMEAQGISVLSSGFLYSETQTTARYQIQLKLEYYKEV